MRVQIIEKDQETIDILQQILSDNDFAESIRHTDENEDIIAEVRQFRPNIAIMPLVIGQMDGLGLVKEIKEIMPDIRFIVISNIFSKEIIGRAYQSGAEYCVLKPMDYLEIESILYRVREKIEIINKLNQIKNLLTLSNTEIVTNNKYADVNKINKAMQKLGILGESGYKDISSIVNYLIGEGQTMSDYTLKEICEKFTENPKTMEQRIRRAATMGMVNIANLGIEDYMNETFIEYSNGIYNFEQIKLEMDYIRKKSSKRGMVNIKKFIDNLIYYAKD